MPAGSPWLQRPPRLQSMPTGVRFWHTYDERYGPLAANPFSRARMALVGTHAMYYVSTDLSGALWETVLRFVLPDAAGRVTVEQSTLQGQRAVQVVLDRAAVPLLPLGQPGLRDLFPTDSAEAFAVAQLLANPNHLATHPEARALFGELQAMGVTDMPALSWPSRQNHTSTVYLAYDPPMLPDWWHVEGDAIALDDPATGHPVLIAELARCGYTWAPGDTTATGP
jgi:hypothetical protein